MKNIKIYLKKISTLLLVVIVGSICSIGISATEISTIVNSYSNSMFGVMVIEEMSDEDPYPPDLPYEVEPVTVLTNSDKPVSAYECTEGYSFGLKSQVRQIYLQDDNISEYSTFSGAPSTCYNCHSYAWYNRSEDNNIWIDYPDVFINQDKHCIPISRDELEEGDIVVCIGYDGNYSHSAVVENVYYDGTIECVSKCGNKGLFLHSLDYLDTMYPNLGMEFYRYTPGKHLIRYNTINSGQHYVDCEASDCNYYELHNTTITSVNDSQHKLACSECNYSEYYEHELYVSYLDDEGCDIRCRDCTYMITCYELPIYSVTDSSGHTVSCPGGCYSFYEEHSFNYMWLPPNNYNRLIYHNATCGGCGASYQLAHNWVSVGGGVVCSDCGLESEFGGVENIMNLSDEELSLLLSSMSEKERAEFVASLPEDAIARVTAILPPANDDELLTE